MPSSIQKEIAYSVEHFYPKHPAHPIAPLTAESHGYFRQESIQATHLVIAGDNTGSIDRLLDGRTNFSMDAHPAMLIEANDQGKDLHIIGSYRNGLPFSIAALPDTIKGSIDLKGRRLCTNRRLGAGERITRTLYNKLGIDPDRDLDVVVIENEGMPEKIAALKEGQADFVVYHHNGPQGRVVKELIRREELVEVIDLSQLFPHYVIRSMATTGRMLREQPEIVKGFIKGVMRGHRFMKEEDPTGSDSVNVLKRALNVDSLAGSGVENGIPKSWPLEPRRIIASVEGIKVHMEELKAAGRIDPGFSVERVVHNGLAEEALSEL